MATLDPTSSPRPLIWRVPVLGAILREWAEGDEDFPMMLVIAVVSLWGVAIMTWGLPALYLPAVAFVPVMFTILILITRG